MREPVEELESRLERALLSIENIAEKVADKKMDAYEGFIETEKYRDIIVEIGYKLKEVGIDITTRTEQL